MKKTGGFTLIEMMVAMVLMLLLVALMFQTFRTADKIGRKTHAWVEIHQNARAMFEFMERDISGAVLAGRHYSQTAGKYFQVADYTYDAPEGSDDMPHEKDAIRLLTSTMNPGGARMAEVAYWLQDRDHADVRKNRLGRYIDYVNDDTEPATTTDYSLHNDGDDLVIATNGDFDSAVTVWGKYKSFDVVASGVTDLKIEYQSASTGNWTASLGSWTNLSTLPRAIRVTAYITDGSGVFLFLDTNGDGEEDKNHKRLYPFCGSGIKFVHTILVSQE